MLLRRKETKKKIIIIIIIINNNNNNNNNNNSPNNQNKVTVQREASVFVPVKFQFLAVFACNVILTHSQYVRLSLVTLVQE